MSMDKNELHHRPNIVLIHGAWADGSSWNSVIERMQADGYHVTAPQFPLTSLADDVARLRQVLALQDGPTVIAGHSYGGQVITALGRDATTWSGLSISRRSGSTRGNHSEGCSHRDLRRQRWPTGSSMSEGFVWLTENDFVNHFAGDVDPVKAKALYAVQQPLSASAFDEVMTVPTWKLMPSWYLVAQDDQALPADVERMFANCMGATTVEVRSGHLAMVSHPDAVVELTETAAEAALAVNAVS